jgi:hypothetical protein
MGYLKDLALIGFGPMLVVTGCGFQFFVDSDSHAWILMVIGGLLMWWGYREKA